MTSAVAAPAERIVLANARLFDGEQGHGDARFSIGLEDGKIAFVRPGPDQPAPGFRSIDVGGRLLMPGMIDAHTHANGASLDVAALDRQSPAYLAHHAGRFLENMVQQGFTTIRDAGGGDMGLVRAIDEGLIDGPRYLVAGKGLSQTGGHGDLRGQQPLEPCACAFSGVFSRVVDGPDRVREAVRDQFRIGAHQVKIFVSGGVLSPTDPIWMLQFNDAEVAVAVEEAARWRSYIMAHAHTKEAIVRCARLGVRSIEHASMLDREAAEVVAAHGAFVVPTISVVDAMLAHARQLPPGALEKLQYFTEIAYEAVRHADEAGTQVGFGTDLLGALQGRESDELVVRGKISAPAAVLRSATSVNARLLGLADQIGHVKAGHQADLIVVAGDPLASLDGFADPRRNIEMVFKGGIVKRDLRGVLAATSTHA